MDQESLRALDDVNVGDEVEVGVQLHRGKVIPKFKLLTGTYCGMVKHDFLDRWFVRIEGEPFMVDGTPLRRGEMFAVSAIRTFRIK